MSHKQSDTDTVRGIKKAGSVISLSAIYGTLLAAAVIWLFGNSYNNTVTFKPLVKSVDKLTQTMEKREDRNLDEHKEIMAVLQGFKEKMSINETKLERVMQDCNTNQLSIERCREFIRNSPSPFPYVKTIDDVINKKD